MKVALVVLSQVSTLKIKLFCVKYCKDFAILVMLLIYQFLSQLCRFHETFILLESFRYGLAWMA